VLEWLDGNDLWAARHEFPAGLDDLAIDLAQVVQAIGELDRLTAPGRRPGERGGPLPPLLDRIDAWLEDPQWHAAELLDVGAVRSQAAESSSASQARVITGFVHGDLIPGNLLVRSQRLHAILDWGSAGYGDTAQDLTPAWAVLDVHSRSTFRDYLGVDDPTWLRARAFALKQAVGGVLYDVPRRHPLGDVMARTLDRILTGQ
jgi:aminoglycoside phosphotransferase (APT) family kinase protein